MVKVEELLEPGEVILKKGWASSGRAFSPTGVLYLTNRRLIFIPNKFLSAVSLSFKPLLKSDHIDIIPLNTIRNFKTSFGALIIEADKKYKYVVGTIYINGWVDALKKAMFMQVQTESMPNYPPPPPPPEYEASAPSSDNVALPPPPNLCPNCGAMVRPTDRFCPRCGYKLK